MLNLNNPMIFVQYFTLDKFIPALIEARETAVNCDPTSQVFYSKHTPDVLTVEIMDDGAGIQLTYSQNQGGGRVEDILQLTVEQYTEGWLNKAYNYQMGETVSVTDAIEIIDDLDICSTF